MTVLQSKQFKRSLKKVVASGRVSLPEIITVINILVRQEKLETKYRDHALKGEYEGYRECHIKPDLLLIYKIEKDVLVLLLANIGSHAQLFG